MNHLTMKQNLLLNRSLFILGLGSRWMGNTLWSLNLRRFVLDGAGSHLPKYFDKEEWIRLGIHHFLVELKKELCWYKAELPEVKMIRSWLEVALRLTGTVVRMTESETELLLQSF